MEPLMEILVNDEFERILKEAVTAEFEAASLHFPEGSRGNHKSSG
jgi:hypothetical protein